MGCGAISALKLRGAYVLAIDTNPAALDKAKQYGADLCYTPQEALERFTGKNRQGISTVMEWGGNEASLDTAVQLTATCGQLCIGGYHTGGKRLVDVQNLNAKAIRVNNTHPREEDLLERCAVNSIKLLERNVWKFQNVPTMVYPAGMYDQAYKDMKSGAGKFMKAVLDMRNVSGQPKLR